MSTFFTFNRQSKEVLKADKIRENRFYHVIDSRSKKILKRYVKRRKKITILKRKDSTSAIDWDSWSFDD